MKQMRYVADDSTIFWATDDESAITRHAEFCGQEVEMIVPFEGVNSGEVGMAILSNVGFSAR